MKLSLKYGKSNISLNIDGNNVLGVLNQHKYKPVNNEIKIVRNSIINKLNDFIISGEKVAIVIPDNTRKAGINIYLPLILRELKKLKIKDTDIKILIATGSHRPLNDEEIIKLVGNEIKSRFKIVCNNAFDENKFFYYKKTKRGTKVYLNKELQSVNKIIATSSILYHYFAGYGGGPKIIMPGLAYKKTIESNHKLTLTKNGNIDKKCRNGNIYDNPVYNDIKDSITGFNNILYIGTILNDDGKIIYACCGNIIKEHKNGAKFLDKIYKVKIKKKADIVVCSTGGFPKDINLIQSHKSINNSFNAVKKNGILICFAECVDGIGSKTFMDYFLIEDIKVMKEKAVNQYSLNAQTALSFRYKLDNCKIILVSSLDHNKYNYIHPNLKILKNNEENISYIESLLNNTSKYIIPSANSLNISY